MDSKNTCKVYFRMCGDFDPDDITLALGVEPDRAGISKLGAFWECGYDTDYEAYTECQMERAIQPLLGKEEILKRLKAELSLTYYLEVVPSLYVGEITPALAPSQKIMKFCVETDTALDIDLYLFGDGDQ